MRNSGNIAIRWARREDWGRAMEMVWTTFLEFDSADYTEEGTASFFNFITDAELFKKFIAGDYKMLLAVDGERIVGVATLRDVNLLSLLFVHKEYHKLGIGTGLIMQLALYLQNECKVSRMIVRSSPYAVDFYRKLGFRDTGDEMRYSGIRVTPMELFFGERGKSNENF